MARKRSARRPPPSRSRRPPAGAAAAAPRRAALPSRAGRPDASRAAVLRAVALVVPPLVYLLLWFLTHDPRPSPAGDNLVYLLLARSLAEGRGLTEIHLPEAAPHTRYPFAFPALLAPVHAMSDGSLAAMKLFIALVGAGGVVLAQRWLRRRAGDAVALAGALALAASPMFLQFADDTFTEVPFLAATFGSLLLWERSEGGRRGWLLGAALGVALLASWIRLIGVALSTACVVALARTGSRRRAALASVTVVAALAVWAPSVLSGGGYGDELAARYELSDARPAAIDGGAGEERPGLARRLAERLVRSTRHFLVEAPLGALLFPWTRPGGFLRVLGGLAAIAALVLYWGPRARSAADPVPAYLLLTFAVLFAWTAPLSRFLLPLLPIVLLAPLALARERGLRVLGAVGALFVLSAFAGTLERVEDAEAVRRELARGNAVAGLAPPSAQLRRAAEWTGVGLPPETVVAARKPQVVFHYGGRPAVPYPRLRDPLAFARALVQGGADVLLVDRETRASLFYLRPFVVAYGAKLPLLYETGEPANTIVLGLAPLRQPGGLEPAETASEWPPPTRMPDLDPTR